MKVENNCLMKVEDDDLVNGEFIFPEGITSIAACAFEGCQLRSVVIPDSISSIPQKTFYRCENLESIIIADSVTTIGNSAFLGCVKLKSLVLPKSLIDIEYNAFAYCRSLQSIVIPESVTKIIDTAFWFCYRLSDIYIDAKTPANYERILALLPKGLRDVILDNHTMFIEKAMLLIAGNKQDGTFFREAKIPEDVTRELIANLAREYCISPFSLHQAYQKFGIVEAPPPEC